jgi:hypothetical protein
VLQKGRREGGFSFFSAALGKSGMSSGWLTVLAWVSLGCAFVIAYVLGINFQYFTIAPMRGISGLKGIWAAVKADTLSLTAFEAGLFGWMAVTHFFIFHPDVKPDQAAYWFMMQIGMCLGFGTAYPINWWLIKRGLKEPM